MAKKKIKEGMIDISFRVPIEFDKQFRASAKKEIRSPKKHFMYIFKKYINNKN